MAAMSDGDRLRMAADRLDGQWSDNTDWVLEATTWDEWAQGWVVTGHATHEVAALLRAVEVGHGVKCWCVGDLTIDARCAAAETLAKTILGDEK